MKTAKLENVDAHFDVTISANDNGIYYISGQRVQSRAVDARVIPFYYVNTPAGKMYVGYLVYKTNSPDKRYKYAMISDSVVCTNNADVLLGLNDTTDIIHPINNFSRDLRYIVETNELNIDII